MKVAHIEAGRHLYGGAEQVRCLIRGLSAAGVSNVLICPRGAALAAVAGPAEVIEMPMAGELDLAFKVRLLRHLDRLRPDMVHVHSRRGADLHGGQACAAGGHPAVVTRRVESAEPAAWLRWKYRPYAAVVAISRAIERDLIERVGLDRDRVWRVSSGVDTERFRPNVAARKRLLETFDLPPDALVVGVSAQLVERKGHAVLLDALTDLVRAHPRLHVVCFGRGPRETRLRRRIVALGFDRRVRLAGFRDDLPALLPGLDILAHPARREGMGLALLEAMSAGVPVVAYAVGGIPDVIDDGVQGLLVPPGEPPALAAALERLIDDPALRSRMGRAGRAHAEQTLSAARMTEGNLRVYRAVLGLERRPGGGRT